MFKLPRRAIIFDLDDTLYAEADFVRSGFRAVADFLAEKHGRKSTQCFEQLWVCHEDGTGGKVFDEALQALDLENVQSVAELVRIYRQHEPRISLFTGTRELLSTLRLDFALGIITDGYLEVQRNKVRALDVEREVDAVVLSDQFGRENWKPSTVPYRAVLDSLDVKPGNAIYLGDNPHKDFVGARRAGMKSIRVRFPAGLHATAEPETAEHMADVEVANLHDVLQVARYLFATAS